MTPSVSQEAGPRGVVRFTTPVRLSIIAITVMAVLALVFILLPRGQGTPPAAGGSASATASAEASSPTATDPTLEPTPTPTPEPTPTPIARWTGLTWVDPVTPSFVVHLNDLVPWDDGYVAVGTVETESGPAARILVSPDGLNWTVAFDPGYDHWPQHLAVLGDELLAFSQRDSFPQTPAGGIVGAPPDTFIWRSTDGEHWSLLGDWPSMTSGPRPEGWDETQYPIKTGLVDVASGPDGLLAIGNSYGENVLIPVLLHSTDGRTWSEVSLPADSPSALLESVVTFDGGFVIVGAVNAGPRAETSTPAAWVSADGRSWTGTSFDVGQVAGSDFGRVVASADGLLASAGAREMHTGPRFTTSWSSPDGLTWSPADVPSDEVAADGTRILAFGPVPQASTGQPWPGFSEAWVSTDAASWTPVTMSKVLDDGLEGMWIVPDGVIYAGVQSFWFATATVAP